MSLSVSKILAPVDFSETSRRALGYALSLAETLGATVTVLHVADPPRRGLEGFRTSDADRDSIADYLMKQAHTDLDAFIAETPEARGRSFERKVEFGRASDNIVDAAGDGAFDMIVMGTTGGAGLTGLLLGSSAQRVIAKAPCPVVAIKNLRETTP